MKKIIITCLFVALIGTAFGQGFVDFRNNTGQNVSTNNTVDIYGNATALTGSGLTFGNAVAPQGYYFILLMQPYSGGPTNNPTTSTLLSSGWLFTGSGATNVVNAGRLGGGSTNLTSFNDPVGVGNQFVVAGWSSNIATNGLAGWLTVSNDLSLGSWTTLNNLPGYFGISQVGTGVGSGSSASPELAFGGTTGIQSGFNLDITPVPEPATLALAGLGGFSLLLFRRKSKAMISVRRLVWLFCLGVGLNAWAGSVSLNPVANITITQKSPPPPNTDLEVGTNGKLENSRSLIKFDIAGNIPSNATITSAVLTLWVYKVPPAPVNSMFDLRAALVSWDGTNASWNNRLVSTVWSSPGGVVGVDFSSKLTQTNYSDANYGYHTFVSNSNLVADLQSWLQNPGTNFGWVMISESEGTAFTVRTMYSTQGTTIPVLNIQYTLPAASPTLVTLPLTNRVFRFNFNAESNHTYAAQYIGSLPGTNWNTLTNFNASPVATNFLVSDPLTPSNRFYRVQTP